MATINSTAATVNIRYEPSAGVNESLFYLPQDAFLPVTPPAQPPVYDLAGYTAVGSVMAECGSVELFALATHITFITDTATGTITDGEGIETTYSIPNAEGIKLTIPPASLAAYPEAYYFINLIAPGGGIIPFAKGQLLSAACGACC
jgi:hypothetical protein